MTRRIVRTDSPAETERLAAALAEDLRGGDVLLLSGALGAGKTRFVRGLARGLGAPPERVSSPTFALCHEYAGSDVTLAHLDAYRLRNAEELESVGWDELRSEERTIMAVEWPERVMEALPAQAVRVRIEHRGPEAREITIEVPPEEAGRFESLRSFSSWRCDREHGVATETE